MSTHAAAHTPHRLPRRTPPARRAGGVLALAIAIGLTACDRPIGLNATLQRDPDSNTHVDLFNQPRSFNHALTINGSTIHAPIHYHALPASPAVPTPTTQPGQHAQPDHPDQPAD